MLAPVEISYKPAAHLHLKFNYVKSKVVPGRRQLRYENNNKWVTIITHSS